MQDAALTSLYDKVILESSCEWRVGPLSADVGMATDATVASSKKRANKDSKYEAMMQGQSSRRSALMERRVHVAILRHTYTACEARRLLIGILDDYTGTRIVGQASNRPCQAIV